MEKGIKAVVIGCGNLETEVLQRMIELEQKGEILIVGESNQLNNDKIARFADDLKSLNRPEPIPFHRIHDEYRCAPKIINHGHKRPYRYHK